MDLNAISKHENRALELQSILNNISFEHKSLYELGVKVYGTGFYLEVKRSLPHSVNGTPFVVNNSVRLKETISDDAFIKTLFRCVGQFEAHEFVESFRYNGKHAYFPHDHEDLYFAMYKQGNSLNKMLLDVWRDVENDHSDFTIAKRYLKRAFVNSYIVKFFIAIDMVLNEKYDKAIETIREWRIRNELHLKLKVLSFICRIDNAIQGFKKGFALDPMNMPVNNSIDSQYNPKGPFEYADE